LLYLSLAFPLGTGYFVGTVVGPSLGISLSVFLIGLPILPATLGGVVLVAADERGAARRLLGADIPPPSWGLSQASRLRDQMLTVLTNPVLWGSLVFVLSKLAIGVAAFTIIVVVLLLGLSLLGVNILTAGGARMRSDAVSGSAALGRFIRNGVPHDNPSQ